MFNWSPCTLAEEANSKIGSETLCSIYFFDLVTLKIARVKIWYLRNYNRDNLVQDGL